MGVVIYGKVGVVKWYIVGVVKRYIVEVVYDFGQRGRLTELTERTLSVFQGEGQSVS